MSPAARRRVVAALTVLLGTTVLVLRFSSGRPIIGSAAYSRGQLLGVGIAVLLLVVGVTRLLKPPPR